MQISSTLVAHAIFILLALFSVAFGGIAAWRLYAFSNTIKKDDSDDDPLDSLEQQGFIPRPARRRTTQCFRLTESGAIRTVKGGYIRPYIIELGETMYERDSLLERKCDEAAGMLSQDKPEGTILHYRIANFTDGGRALNDHLAASGKVGEVHELARILHEAQINYVAASVELERYKDFNSSLWAFVPIKHEKDHDKNGTFVEFRRALKRGGVFAAFKSLFEGGDGITKRLQADEEAALERAEKVFRRIEDSSPVKLKRPSRDDAWQMLYYGHNESATSAPPTPPPHADLRAYLCRDTITVRKDDWHGIHGRTTFAIISMFVPPEDGSTADIMRSIYMNARLSRRFTVIPEYVFIEKAKARKRLSRRAEMLWKANVTKGGVKMDEDTARAFNELKALNQDLTRTQETLAGMDFRIIIYGTPLASRAEEKESVKQLELDCERMIAVLRKAFPGCDVGREEGAALRALYHRSLVGEMSPKKSYRTIYEATDTLASFIPLERAWRGIKNPHSLVSTTVGNLIGLNFYENEFTSSALGFIIAEPGGGKSVTAIRFVSDILGVMKGAHGAGIDFGESFAPFADFIGSRKWRFMPDEPKAINVWDYPGLERRIMPDDTQKKFVIEDALILARAPRGETEGALYEAVVRKCVEEVYNDEVPNNRPGWPKHEPQHKHLVRKLQQFPFEGQQKIIALNLASILEGYIGNPWIDSPTHPDYYDESIFDLFELDSLSKFAADIQRTLAFRVATRVCNRIGKLDANGELMPTILVFDECRRIAKDYPEIMTAIRFNAARQGRKKRVFTLLCSQSWADFKPIADVTATAGVKIIGRMADDDEIDSFVKAAKWPARAREAIHSIHNIKGIQSQFVISFGSSENMQIEMIQVELSPLEYWNYTSAAIEQNARNRVLRLVPQWTMPEAVAYLAVRHPRGLVAQGLQEPDLSGLPEPIYDERFEHSSLMLTAGDQEQFERAQFEERTLEGYRLLAAGTPGDVPADLMEFAVRGEEQLTAEAGEEAAGVALTNMPEEEIAGEFVGDAEQAAREDVYTALERLFDERDKVGRERASDLGIDVEGAIVVEPEEALRP